ncbi:MAG: ATP-dependent DNA ligase [Sphingomonadaceae bacterium]|nr:ATP-dependent DNA ligase [Sphingomonadaceae bacterium]
MAPMEARLVAELPESPGWQFEPKWDGFRCLAFCTGNDVALSSKSGKPLGRYFPEIVDRLGAADLRDAILDGELILPIGSRLSFGALQARLHPAESRIRKLARETPAQLMLFDCLQNGGEPLIERPLRERRAHLERLHAAIGDAAILLSPKTDDGAVARVWLARMGDALDGIVAKRLDGRYEPGERAMLKIKQLRSADCVVGGFRYDRAGTRVASLLLGLYDDAAKLDHVGFTSALANEDKRALTARLEALIEPPGFTGKAPGGPSRWTTERSADWQPLRPELVVEVRYDQITDDRFRHGTRLLRWRPDKAPRQCRMEQLAPPLRPSEIDEIV